MKKISFFSLLALFFSAMLIFSGCNFSTNSNNDLVDSPPPTTCEQHTWDEGKIERLPTCFNLGEILYTCLVCNEFKTEPIEYLPHTYSEQWSFDEFEHYHEATCECSFNRIDVERHTWDEGEPIVPSTCAENGTTLFTCTVCNATKTEKAYRLPHTYSDEWTTTEYYHYREAICGCKDEKTDWGYHNKEKQIIKAATCKEEGLALYTCTVCSATSESSIPKTYEHVYDKGVITEPTCRRDGYTTYTCTLCGSTFNSDYVDKTPDIHSYTVVTVTPPTCKYNGYTTHKCEYCSMYYVDSQVDKLPHSYESLVVDPTCTAEGYTIHTCSGCKDNYTDTYTEKIEHQYTPTVIAPTCTNKGRTEYVCVCGKWYNDDYVDALGHSYEPVIVPSTCKVQGYTNHICTRCGDNYKDNYTDLLYHDYELTKTQEPTCADYGYKQYSCKNCGSPMTETIYQLPHTYTTVVTEPTCKDNGYTTYTCSVCNYSRRTDYTYTVDHDYVNILCRFCGKKEYSIGLSYALSKDETYYIITGIGTCTDTDLILPNVHQGLPVLKIESYAFKDCKTISSITFLDGNNKQEIGNHAFYGCNFTELNINGNVTTIGEYAFYNCANLLSLNIGKNVSSIGICAFAYCSKLSEIVVDSENTNYYSLGNCLVEVATRSIILGCKNSHDPTYSRPSGFDNSVLVSIPNDKRIISIGSYAFYGQTEIEILYVIPKNINYIGKYAFGECSKLRYAYFESESDWYVTEDEQEAYQRDGGWLLALDTLLPRDIAGFLNKIDTNSYWYKKI